MHGLKSAGDFSGWTRLCDEWLVGLERFSFDGGGNAWDTASNTLVTLTDAAERTRRFARGGADVADIAPDDAGLLRFELQGYDYVVATAQVWPGRDASLVEAAEGPLTESMTRAKAGASGEDVPVGLVFVTPRLSPEADAEERLALAENWVATMRSEAETDALAFAFPKPSGTFRGHYGSGALPGCFLVARRAR